jgi:hypothetical protein
VASALADFEFLSIDHLLPPHALLDLEC